MSSIPKNSDPTLCEAARQEVDGSADVDGFRYAGAAPMYWRAGWTGLLPLPYRKKRSPPEGWTGRSAPYPDVSTVQGWCRTRGRGNLALRLPVGLLGIDVDVYDDHGGGAALDRLTELCGALPPTWTSTSRDDGSGIRFFRVPTGVRWREKHAGAGIELVHSGHRYAVVWPSAHDQEPWRPYRWYVPDGRAADRVPRVDELPELPFAWVQRLRERDAVAGQAGTHPGGGGQAVVESGSGYARPALAGAVAELSAMRSGSGRNNALNRKAYHLGGLVAAGMLDEQTVRAELLAAAHANGYVADRDEQKALATIESGLRAGQLAPRRVGAGSARYGQGANR